MSGQLSTVSGAIELDRDMDLLEAIVEHTVARLAYLDSGFTYVRVNSAYAEGAGHHIEDLVGRNHFDLFPQSENRAVFEQVRDTGEPASFQAMPVEFPQQIERGMTFGTDHWSRSKMGRDMCTVWFCPQQKSPTGYGPGRSGSLIPPNLATSLTCAELGTGLPVRP